MKKILIIILSLGLVCQAFAGIEIEPLSELSDKTLPTFNENQEKFKRKINRVSKDLEEKVPDASASDGLVLIGDTDNENVWDYPESYQNIQVFTTPGANTFTKPANVDKVFVEVVGGGGGGGGVGDVTQAGGGGGAGGYCCEVCTITANVTVTIGAAGAASALGDFAGGAGGASSFGSFCTANGGSGGEKGTEWFGGAGGTATGGDINISGQTGGYYAAGGGDSMYGFGGAYEGPNTTAGAAKGYGAGGNGARNTALSDANRSGAAGTAGIVIVRY